MSALPGTHGEVAGTPRRSRRQPFLGLLAISGLPRLARQVGGQRPSPAVRALAVSATLQASGLPARQPGWTLSGCATEPRLYCGRPPASLRCDRQLHRRSCAAQGPTGENGASAPRRAAARQAGILTAGHGAARRHRRPDSLQSTVTPRAASRSLHSSWEARHVRRHEKLAPLRQALPTASSTQPGGLLRPPLSQPPATRCAACRACSSSHPSRLYAPQ